MLGKIGTKIAMRKAGFSGFSVPTLPTFDPASTALTNPFANIKVPKVLESWQTPPPAPIDVAPEPVIGAKAPDTTRLRIPGPDRRQTVVVFLRHCGCPCRLPDPSIKAVPKEAN